MTKKLTHFYLELSTNDEKMTMFNSGFSEEEITANRRRMLAAEGIEQCEHITRLSQTQLHEEMGKHLSGLSQNK